MNPDEEKEAVRQIVSAINGGVGHEIFYDGFNHVSYALMEINKTLKCIADKLDEAK